MQATLKTQSDQAMFNEDLASSYFPNVKVLYISGTQTCSFCMWAHMECQRLHMEALERGKSVRSTMFKLIEGGNHFVSDLL